MSISFVARTYLGLPPTPLHQVSHKDKVRNNNVVSNLEWRTPQEQATHKLKPTRPQRPPGNAEEKISLSSVPKRWRTIPPTALKGYKQERYEVSDCGDIRVKGGALLCQTIDQGGYLHIALSCGKKRISVFVHRLVAFAFIPNSDATLVEVDHLNFKRSDNRVENLQWVTRQCNITRAKGVKIAQYTIDGLWVATFDSQNAAGRSTGFGTGGIVHSTVTGKPFRGFQWKREDNVTKYDTENKSGCPPVASCNTIDTEETESKEEKKKSVFGREYW